MAWRQTGDKALTEPMLTQFIDAHMRHLGWDELTHWGWTKMADI